MKDPEVLERLCRLCGIEPEYTDIWGMKHHVPERTLRALLSAMGHGVDNGAGPDRFPAIIRVDLFITILT